MEEKRPKWFYRSDNYPMDRGYTNLQWTEYECSNSIEKSFIEYEISISLKKKDKDYKNYLFHNFPYCIDFEMGIQYHRKDVSRQRIVGRFLGDPYNSRNTIGDRNFIYKQLSRKLVISTKTINDSVRCTFFFDINFAYKQYMYVDIIIQLIEMSEDYNQSIEDLYQLSTVHINSFENNKEKEFSNLKIFIDDSYNSKLISNAVGWYTNNSFVYRMINQVFQIQSYLDIFYLRFCIFALKNSFKLGNSSIKIKTLYKGTIVSKDELQFIKASINKNFMIYGFTSATSDKNIAIDLIKNHKKNESESILLVFELENCGDNKIFSMKNFSLNKGDDDYVININNFFKISKIEDEEDFYKVYLNFSLMDDIKSSVSDEVLKFEENLRKKMIESHKIESFYLIDLLISLEKEDEVTKFIQNPISERDDGLNKFNEIYLGITLSKKGLNEKGYDQVKSDADQEKKIFLKALEENLCKFNNQIIQLSKKKIGESEFYQSLATIIYPTLQYIKEKNKDSYLIDLATYHYRLGEFKESILMYIKAIKVMMKKIEEEYGFPWALSFNIGFAFLENEDHKNGMEYILSGLEDVIKQLNTSGNN